MPILSSKFGQLISNFTKSCCTDSFDASRNLIDIFGKQFVLLQMLSNLRNMHQYLCFKNQFSIAKKCTFVVCKKDFKHFSLQNRHIMHVVMVVTRTDFVC